MIVFDTSAVIRLFERREPDVVGVVRRYRKIAVCAVTLGEFERGIAASADGPIRQVRRAALGACVEVADVIHVDRQLAATWGQTAESSPRKLSHNDLWIVATAVLLKLPLCSSDDRLLDFAGALDLTVEAIDA